MTQAADTAVRKEIVVQAPIERAFDVFTSRFGDVKPREHNLLGAPIVETDNRSSGEKVGLGTPITCSQTFTQTIPGQGTVTGEITVEVLIVPPK